MNQQNLPEIDPKIRVTALLTGIFGELENCNGVMEGDLIHPPEGGEFMKIVGCSYLYKGYPDERKVFGLEQAKSNISTIPRQIIGASWLYMAAVGLRYIFQRKKFIHDVHIYFAEIQHKTMRHVGKPYDRYSSMVKEIARAFDLALQREFNVTSQDDLAAKAANAVKYHKNEAAFMFMKILAFVCMIIEFDAAYRFRIQDALGEVDNVRARKSGRMEMMRILDILISRETVIGRDVAGKWKFIKFILNIFFLTSARSRRMATTFLSELNAKKVGLDDADWYFCLRRDSYNFRGMTLDQRLEELKKIDKEKGHYYVKIEYVPAVPTAPAPAKP